MQRRAGRGRVESRRPRRRGRVKTRQTWRPARVKIAALTGVAALLIVAGVALAAEGELSFVNCYEDAAHNGGCSDESGAVEGLDGAEGIAVSPDSKHVYVASRNESALAVFSRNSATGALIFVEVQRDGVGLVDGLAGARGVAVSPDGKHVYVASINDEALAVFSRDVATGELTFVEVEKDGDGGVDGLDGARNVAVSADGKSVYVVGLQNNSLVAFSRNSGNGELTFVEFEEDGSGGVDGLEGAEGVAVSPDDRHVYVASEVDDALTAFSRSSATGELTFVEFEKDEVDSVDGLDRASGVAVSADGKHLYVASDQDDSLAVFSRDPTSGAMSFVEFEDDGAGGVDGLDGARNAAVSPDGGSVYAASFTDEAVAAFGREADVTAPDTSIDSGSGPTADPTPTFTFSSSDPAFTSGYECALDFGPFTACVSPHTSAAGADGEHSFRVRATDTAGNVDQSPASAQFTLDTTAATLTLKGKKNQKSSKLVKVKVSCDEACTATGSGTLKTPVAKGSAGAAKSKKSKLKPKTVELVAGETKTLKLALKKKARKLVKKSRKKSKAKVTVSAVDAVGNEGSAKRTVKLKTK